MKIGASTRIITALVMAVCFGSCFTGVESTRRITSGDVRRQQAATVTPEQVFLAGIVGDAPRQWKPGKAFRVSSDRIRLVFTPASDSADSLPGRNIYFDSFRPARSLTGDDATDVVFTDDNGHIFYYRHNAPPASIDTMQQLSIPFTVDCDLVERIDHRMRGQRYYISSSAWLDPGSGKRADTSLRHVEVEIDSVTCGSDNYPALVHFHVSDADFADIAADEYAVLMTIGSSRAATRNFETIFSFSNPRKAYPEIEKSDWQLIVRGRVTKGMSREACRLALGTAPTIERFPTYAGMAERWTFSDGVYLFFEDGILTKYRL